MDNNPRRWSEKRWIAIGIVGVLLFAFSACGVNVALPTVAVITQCPLPATQLGHGGGGSSGLGLGAGPGGLAPDQQQNASAILAEVKKEGLPQQAGIIAITAALAEDSLHNSPVAQDHDSVGLFQQRPSQGWGTVQQIMDPAYATSKFLEALKKIPGWDKLPVDAVVQLVQKSGAPQRYAQFISQAQQIVQQLWGGAQSGQSTSGSPGAPQGAAQGFTCDLGARPAPQGEASPNPIQKGNLPFPIPSVMPPPGWKLQIPVPQFPGGLPGTRVNPPAITPQCVAGALWAFAAAHITDAKFAKPPAMDVYSAYQMTAKAQQQGWKMDPSPQIGDMVVYKNGSFYGPNGHVGLVVGTSGSSYMVAEQNFINETSSMSGWGTWDLRTIQWPDTNASGFIAAPPG